jgi:hypothetical protein
MRGGELSFMTDHNYGKERPPADYTTEHTENIIHMYNLSMQVDLYLGSIIDDIRCVEEKNRKKEKKNILLCCSKYGNCYAMKGALL